MERYFELGVYNTDKSDGSGVLGRYSSMNEAKEAINTFTKEPEQIFIIDGVMVCNNKIVGHYNGSFVTDRYDEQPYYVEVKADNHDVMNMRKNAEAAVSEEVVTKEICFSDYSRVVDEFFALLE